MTHPLNGDHGSELRAAKDESGVNIVANSQQIVADTDFCHLLKVLFGIDGAGGVIGGIDQNRPGLGGDQALQPLGIEGKIFIPPGLQKHRHATGQTHLVGIHHEIGVRNDDLVPGIDGG